MEPKRVPSMSFDGFSTGATTGEEMLDVRSTPRPASPMSGLSKSRSEDFEKIENEGGDEEAPDAGARQRSGSWLPWSWGSGSGSSAKTIVAPKSTSEDVLMMGTESSVEEKGKSSGVEI